MKSLFDLALPKFTLLIMLFKKPLVLMAAVPLVVVSSIVVDFESVSWLLFGMFLGDLGSGIGASYFVWKKSDHVDRWFFGKGEGFNSDKAKKMGVKAMVYLSVPLMLVHLQKILFLKNFKYERISDAEFEWATISLIVFCAIEGFSIFHENLPKCGFNLWHQIKKMIGFYKEVKSEIQE